MVSLSPGTVRRIAALFPEAERDGVAALLTTECGDNLPFVDASGAEGIERIRYAVLKIGNGSLDRLLLALGLARRDWRDALVGAGFAEDVRAHLHWLPEA